MHQDPEWPPTVSGIACKASYSRWHLRWVWIMNMRWDSFPGNKGLWILGMWTSPPKPPPHTHTKLQGVSKDMTWLLHTSAHSSYGYPNRMTFRGSRIQTSSMDRGKLLRPHPYCCWQLVAAGRETASSLRVWPLVGFPCSSRWFHTRAHMTNTK